ncbi:MAG: serine/threonine protein kinase [Planctomycetaceae bacterium]|nr:serine/threonine protein kinase [Planctomycetaceae bacterium]
MTACNQYSNNSAQGRRTMHYLTARNKSLRDDFLYRSRCMSVGLIVLYWIPLVHAVEKAEVWKNFRGPGGQGMARTADIPLRWSEKKNVKWKTRIPGRGFSAPVIDRNQVWLTTAFDVPSNPEEITRRTVNNTGSEPITVSDSATMYAICIDRNTGKIIREIELLHVNEPQWVHVENSYATPTPVIEGNRLYCHFGTFGTVCVDTHLGEIVWTNTDHQVMHENGPASNPILWNDLLIFHCDGSDEQYIAAIDKETGDFAWKTPRSGSMHANPQLKKAYGTPVVMRRNGKTMLLSPAANWLYAYDPATGEELWKVSLGKLGFSIVPVPVVDEENVYVCTGYVSANLVAYGPVRPDKAPDILWQYRKQVPHKSSPLLVDGRLYFISDRGGVLTCLAADSGEVLYRKRLSGGYSASPIALKNHIVFFSDTGKATILRPGSEFELIAENEIAGRIQASPAVAGDALYIRTETDLYKIAK